MLERPRLWHRVCAACGQLDASYAWIANDGAAGLDEQPWRCPCCGSADTIAARRLEDADLAALSDESIGG